MTREEKVNLLNELLEIEEKNDIGNLTRADRREFQEWVIKALEQEPTDEWQNGYDMAWEEAEVFYEKESCDDAVSRDSVQKEINCWIGSGEYRYTNATDYLNKRIKALQAVNPQEKAGYWMPIEYPTGVEAFGVKEMSAQELQCSECGKTVDISDGDFKYCPYCKAKMVES